MKKKNAIALVLGMMMTLPASAQWTNYDTQSTIRGVFGLANAALESAERKKEMEILYNIFHPCATESLRFSFSRLLCAMLIFLCSKVFSSSPTLVSSNGFLLTTMV